MKHTVIDILSTGEYPSCALSNFYPHSFVLDGIKCASVEGFLQSLKTKNKVLQKYVCSLSGKEAKLFFRHKPQSILWKLTGNLYWRGKIIKRTHDDYQLLLDKAYDALMENENFVQALVACGDAELTHSIGKKDERQTILTEYEFISRICECRNRIKKSNGG